MEKKNNGIAKNSSSGKEKVENIAARAQEKADEVGVEEKAPTEKKTVKKAAPQKAANAKKPSAKSKNTAKLKKEKAAAKKRVDAALKKEEKKAQKEALKAERKAKKAEKAAEMKARRAELLAERKEKQAARKAKAEARREKLKEERKAREAQLKEKRAIRKAELAARKELLKKETKQERDARLKKERAKKAKARKERKARAEELRLAQKEARLKKKEKRLEEKQHERGKQRTPGFGGWLAAVISLGAVTLALATVVTVGAIDMTEMNATMGAGNRANLYELVGVVDAVDNDLNKLRVSSDPNNQSVILTDLLVQSRLAESNLEKFPIDMEADVNLTSFINRTSGAAQAMLAKLRAGERLSERDISLLEKLYETNHKVRAELNELSASMTEKDMMKFMKEKKGNTVFEHFHNMENLTVESDFGAEGPNHTPPEPRGGEESEKKEMITSDQAEEICLGYFKDYQIRKIEYAGETTSGAIDSYNFFLTDDKDRTLFAEISRKDGALIEFDFYEYCTDKNFDVERCKAIAEDYLASLGYENMTAVWVNESGAEVMFNFLYEQDGAVFYADSVKVKVCETKGKVVGFDAVSYLKHHRERQGLRADLTIGEAMEKLNGKLTVETVRLAVIPDHSGERVTYEFLCTYGEDMYFIYIDANTGAEARILGMVDSAQGRMLF
ncbi:MAG: germination protein YpeB [Clostridia bacterium]|nr:germination protein YpeB [Clostridia bacterium]